MGGGGEGGGGQVTVAAFHSHSPPRRMNENIETLLLTEFTTERTSLDPPPQLVRGGELQTNLFITFCASQPVEYLSMIYWNGFLIDFHANSQVTFYDSPSVGGGGRESPVCVM